MNTEIVVVGESLAGIISCVSNINGKGEAWNGATRPLFILPRGGLDRVTRPLFILPRGGLEQNYQTPLHSAKGRLGQGYQTPLHSTKGRLGTGLPDPSSFYQGEAWNRVTRPLFILPSFYLEI